MQSVGLARSCTEIHHARRFLGQLSRGTLLDPEEKRKIIGREFIRCFEKDWWRC